MFQFAKNHGDQTICISTANASIEIHLQGGQLIRWRRQAGEEVQELIDGYDPASSEAFEPFFKSSKLSPFVCRLREGKYPFEEKDYQIGYYFLGPHAIHGLLYKAPFTLVNQGSNADKAWVEMGHAYLGTEPGYPFNLHLKLVYTLDAAGQVTIDTTVTNTGTSNCPLADGWHPYFRLDLPVDDCELTLNSRLQVEMDDTLIPTGGLLENETYFHGPQRIGDHHFDDCFQLEPLTAHLPQARVKGRLWLLEIFANENYPFLQVFTPDHRSTIALENLSGLPDCFNNLGGLLVLAPGEQQRFSCGYQAHFLGSEMQG